MTREQEIRQWIDALKSGKYVKGTNMLKKTPWGSVDEHCCLGVKYELDHGPDSLTWEPGTCYYVTPEGKSDFYYPSCITEELAERLAYINDNSGPLSYDAVIKRLEQELADDRS